MKHERKAGVIERGGYMYYTCKFGVGHKVHVVDTQDGKWVVMPDKITVDKVNVTHEKGVGVKVTYFDVDGNEYYEEHLHLTMIDAKIDAMRMNKQAGTSHLV